MSILRIGGIKIQTSIVIDFSFVSLFLYLQPIILLNDIFRWIRLAISILKSLY